MVFAGKADVDKYKGAAGRAVTATTTLPRILTTKMAVPTTLEWELE